MKILLISTKGTEIAIPCFCIGFKYFSPPINTNYLYTNYFYVILYFKAISEKKCYIIVRQIHD